MAAGGGADAAGAGAAGVEAAGAEFGFCFLAKSAKGSAVTAGAGAPAPGLGTPAVAAAGLAAVASAGTSGVTGLLCIAPFGFQSLFFSASTAS